MRNGRTRGDRFRSPLRYFRRSRQRKGRFSKSRIASFFLSMVKHVVEQNSQQNKNPCKLSVYKDFLVGVTGFEPALALPSRIVVSALRHSLSADTPCFVGKNFEKTPHRGVFPSFSLDPGFGRGRSRWFNRKHSCKTKSRQMPAFCFGRSDWI